MSYYLYYFDKVIEYIDNNPIKSFVAVLILLSFRDRKVLLDKLLLIHYAISGNEKQIAINYAKKIGLNISIFEPLPSLGFFGWLLRLLRRSHIRNS